MLIATFLLYVPLHIFIEPYAGIHAIWIAMIIFMLARELIKPYGTPLFFHYTKLTKVNLSVSIEVTN